MESGPRIVGSNTSGGETPLDAPNAESRPGEPIGPSGPDESPAVGVPPTADPSEAPEPFDPIIQLARDHPRAVLRLSALLGPTPGPFHNSTLRIQAAIATILEATDPDSVEAVFACACYEASYEPPSKSVSGMVANTLSGRGRRTTPPCDGSAP